MGRTEVGELSIDSTAVWGEWLERWLLLLPQLPLQSDQNLTPCFVPAWVLLCLLIVFPDISLSLFHSNYQEKILLISSSSHWFNCQSGRGRRGGVLSCYPGNDIQTIIATAERHLEDTVVTGGGNIWSLALWHCQYHSLPPTLPSHLSTLYSLLCSLFLSLHLPLVSAC